jgi:CMP/dCMP kinase
MIIAIDGPAASGKGTLARLAGQHFQLPVLDTGLLYRAVARDLVKRRFALDDLWAAVALARSLDPLSLDDPDLRGALAGDAASVAAKIPQVRAALMAYQRGFAGQPGGAILDGRDIGTVICPTANVKIYVTASPEVRARRRFGEIVARGEATTFEQVLADIARRDERDAGRGAAPMKPAHDAVLLDTSAMDIDGAYKAAVGIIEGTARAGRGA